MGVAPQVRHGLGVGVGQRPALADHAALLLQDQGQRFRAQSLVGDHRLRQGVLHLRLGQPEQGLHELLAGGQVHAQAHVRVVRQAPQLQIDQRLDLQLVGQREVEAPDLLLQCRQLGEGGADEEDGHRPPLTAQASSRSRRTRSGCSWPYVTR